MKKLAMGVVSALVLWVGVGVAGNPPVLSNVSYQVTEQEWVKTSKATAVVAINATVSDQNIASLRESILSNLQKIVAGEWHITQFNRQKTNSGLESVVALAQIRLPSEQLNEIYQRVKAVSRAGQTYKVMRLNFSPDPADIAMAQSSLRQKVYLDVQNELKKLNQQFPGQNYFVHQIRFVPSAVAPRALSLVRMAGNVSTPSVSQQLSLSAQVELSSKIKSSKNSG